MIHKLMLKLSVKISKSPLFVRSAEEQRKYIYKFKEPKTLFQRSFLQYKSQMRFRGILNRLVCNFVAAPIICLYLLQIKFRKNAAKTVDAVYDLDGSGMMNVLPKSLINEFPNMQSTKNVNGFLTFSDKMYVLNLMLKRPLSCFFAFKVLVKIRRIRGFISEYNPRAIIVCNEFSFTSSCLTDFCNKNGVELINVMHGEKLFNIRDSFFAFNRCYIWHEFYRDLFLELRAEPNQFIVELPPSMLFESGAIAKAVDFTYYLQDQKEYKLKVIVDKLNQLVKSGNTVAIRPHPRYTNLNELNACLGDANIEVENCKEISIEHSILRTNNVISVYSTVLQQGYYNGVNVVIDDVSDPIMFSKLVEYKYVVLKSEHKLLSNIVPSD